MMDNLDCRNCKYFGLYRGTDCSYCSKHHKILWRRLGHNYETCDAFKECHRKYYKRIYEIINYFDWEN